jgi:repressor LexA
MADTLSEWLKRSMDRRGLRPSQVARYLDLTPSAVSRWINGRGVPSPDSCARLAALFDEPIELVYGLAGWPTAGSMPQLPQRSIRERAVEWLSDLPVAVPVYEQLGSAGPGQQIMDYVYLEPSRVTTGRHIAIRVKGSSMEPEILDGDYVVMDTEASAEAGDTVVATVGEEVYVKRLRNKRGQLVLSGRTGDIPADDAKIEGVAIQVIHNLRR